jgi:hypothetical protein
MIFLIVPFKFIFLNSLHFASHIVAFENPYHYHGDKNHGHDHNVLEVLSHAVDDFSSDARIPVELSSFKFQVPFPQVVADISLENHPSDVTNRYPLLVSGLITGPAKEVLLPPP